MSPNTCNDVKTGDHLHKPHNPIEYPIIHACNLLQQNFSRGIFWMQLIRNHVTLYRYDYTLSNLARQGFNYDGGLNPRLCGWVGVPCITDMSPKPNTDYNCFIFSDPKYIRYSPPPAMPNRRDSEFSGSSMPPTAPNTITSPTMNLIILYSFIVKCCNQCSECISCYYN